jgi:hypothetical protein
MRPLTMKNWLRQTHALWHDVTVNGKDDGASSEADGAGEVNPPGINSKST